MSIEYKPYQNIFDSKCGILVNPVNCFGVMGAGLAKQFAKNFPGLEEDYRKLCESGELQIGNVVFHRYMNISIALFPTKNHWQTKSKLSYIESGLQSLYDRLCSYDDRSVAIPQLGCGLGGLEWKDVQRLIIRRFEFEKIKVEVYGPEKVGVKVSPPLPLVWVQMPENLTDLIKKNIASWEHKYLGKRWITMCNGFHIVWIHNINNDLHGILVFKDEKFILNKFWLSEKDLKDWIDTSLLREIDYIYTAGLV